MFNNYRILFRRLRSFLFIFLDIFFFQIIFYIANNSLRNILYENFILFTWIIISYLIGRYYLKSKSKKDIYIRSITYTFLLLILCNLSTSILSFIFEKIFLINSSELFITLDALLIIILYSFLSNIFINIYNSENKRIFGNWIVLENEDSIFKSENLFLNLDYKSNFFHITDIDNCKNKYGPLSGIIISDNLKFNINDNKVLSELQKLNLPIFNYQNWCKDYLFRYPPELFANKNLLLIDIHKLKNSIDSRSKRFFDFFVSFLLLIVLAPLILISCILIKIEDNGPVFYSQIRTGYLGKEFRIWKIRTMKVNAEPKGPVWSSKNDKRTLRIGKILRFSRIDELPQLISVIKGEMSLIGPRPERPEIEVDLIKKIPNYMYRYQAKPGLSGWAQVNYPYGASVTDSKNKLSYDLFYIMNYSIFLDIIIFMNTLRIVINRNNSKPL